jgi:imidazolonepropionase-like amidohydrolase
MNAAAWCALFALAIGTPAHAQRATAHDASTRVLVVDSVRVVDVAAARTSTLRRIVIRGDTIAAVTNLDAPLPATVDVLLNARGAYAIPGLVDHHVHLVPRQAAALERAARGGVTMVNSMAGDARVAGEYARQVIMKELAAPEIVFASVLAGPGFFIDPRFRGAGVGFAPGTAPWAQAMTDTTDLVRAVARARGSGAELLKLYAMLDSTLAARITNEAHAQGMRVVAHGTVFPARPLQLVQAGVDVLTHVPYLSWQGATSVQAGDVFKRAEGPYASVAVNGTQITTLVDAMVKAGTALEPTLYVFLSRESPAVMRAWSLALTRRAHERGVPILAGTDNLIGADSTALPNIHAELAYLVEAGLSPVAALATATVVPARVMGRAATHGAIAPGFVADLVLIEEDPLVDISATRKIRKVVLRGRVLAR